MTLREGVRLSRRLAASLAFDDVRSHEVGRSTAKVTALAVPQLAPCASSARAWRLRAARYSQSEAQPLGARPPPWGFKQAASKVAAFDANDHPDTCLDSTTQTA